MNPLIPLITSLATRNRNYVLFAGAGLSKDAGVKSGWEILIETLKPLYIDEKSLTVLPDDYQSDIEKWYLEHEKLNKLGYSEILEIMHKGEIERREYLKDFFKDEIPGDAHKQIATLVANGLIRFIFTTNFGDLIEKALDEQNLDYDVIFSDEVLQSTKSWDKVKTCRIYKLHGDYKTGKIRNTVEELESLDIHIADDFQYIIDRHGLIVIGYAGRDKAIMNHFISRKPYAFPFYWQIRSHPKPKNEFEFYYDLMNKYKDEYNRSIIYIENNSASNFLSEINNGIDKLEITLVSNQSESDKFRKFIINQDNKKIRALSLDLVNDFKSQYITSTEKAALSSQYLYKFGIFKDFINDNSKVLSYLNELLVFDLLNEAKIFTQKIHLIILDFYPVDYDFIRKPILYYFLMTMGSIFLKYNHHIEYTTKLYSYNYKSHDYNKYNVITDISYYEVGWEVVAKEEFNKNYINPKFSIIDEYLLPDFLSKKEYIEFDAYITIDLLLIDNKEHPWECGSVMFPKEFMDFFIKYFDKLFTKEKANRFVERINKKYYGYQNIQIRGLTTLKNYLIEKFKL